ncbi:alpha/beta fold hydrolase [Kribbella sp. CA-247076]|uniref:alpha/beta fold hydrolase n=1 Tax=Kribbella sp. CA-247076 TaxID=3239941 RepID=UPI003D90A0BB
MQTQEFVRYSPDLETIDPDLEKYLAKIIEFWEQKGRESPVVEGTGRAVRGAHAKAIGVVRGELDILGDVPAPYAQGIYARPCRHDVALRFSSASNHLGPDAQLGPVLGLALKIFGVDGVKLVDEEPEAPTFDLVLKNSPTFIANTAKHYLFIEEIGNNLGQYLARGQAGFHDLLGDFVTGKGTLEQHEWAWDELFAFIKTATRTPVRNPLLTTYFSMAAVRHGDYVAKVRVAAAAGNTERARHHELDLTSGPDVYGPVVADELTANGFDFDLQVQLCADLDKMPVNRATVEWPEKLSPYVTVGRIRVPPQDVSRNVEAGDALAFNQWRVTDQHRPLGEIMNVRRIYTASAKVRRTLNHQPQLEPTSVREVFDQGPPLARAAERAATVDGMATTHVPGARFRTVDGVRIRYADSEGSHEPTVLLTSPWPESLYAFAPIWATLAERARVVAVDLPGFGRSERRDDLMSPRAMGGFLGRLISELDLGRPYVVAPDVGTAAALFAAADHPEQLAGLVVGAGGVAVPVQLGDPLKSWVLDPDLEKYRHTDPHAVVNTAMDTHAHDVPDEIRADYLTSYEGDRFFESMAYVRRYPEELPVLAELLPTIATPVTIIGALHDRVVPMANAEFLAERIPDSRLVVLEAGHFAWEDTPAEYAATILGALKNQSESR